MDSAAVFRSHSCLNTLVEAAHAAGDIILEGRSRSFGIQEKSTANFVTEIDKAAEAAIRKILQRDFPDIPVLGEEEGGEVQDALEFWVVDPLDGTTNFVKGIQYYSVSIALARREAGGIVPVAGGVYNPVSQELFWAVRGEGAWLRLGSRPDVRLSCTQVARLEESLFITGFYYDRGEKMRQTLRQIEDFFNRGMICVRRFGSAALDLCQVASGRADGFWEHILNPWDYAAGQLLVEESGGRCSKWNGAALNMEPSSILASGPKIYSRMQEVVLQAQNRPGAGN